MAKKRKPAAKKRKSGATKRRSAPKRAKRMTAAPASRPASARSAKSAGYSPDTIVNALAILLVIIIALAAGYLYQSNTSVGASPPAAAQMEKK